MTKEEPYTHNAIGSQTLETLEGARRYNLWISHKIRPFLGKCNVELGAGQGTISALLAKDFPLYLSELSEDNLRILKERFKGNKNVLAIEKDLLSVLAKYAPVDCVYSSNVLEHIEKDIELICESAQYIRPGGYFVAVVPASMFLYSNFDKKIGHYRRYSKKRIKSSREINELYSISRLRYFDPLGAVGWWVKMRLLASEELPQSGLALFEALMPVLRLWDKLPQAFGKNLLIALQKR